MAKKKNLSKDKSQPKDEIKVEVVEEQTVQTPTPTVRPGRFAELLQNSHGKTLKELVESNDPLCPRRIGH